MAKTANGSRTEVPKLPKKGTKPLKYNDKSPGQPLLATVFEQLSAILRPYAKGSLTLQADGGGQLHLQSTKTIGQPGEKKLGVHFASLLVQKGYVGLYLMPVYAEPLLKNSIHPSLLQLLKGKSCFHIKKLDDALKSHVEKAIQAAYALYLAKGLL